MFDFLINCNMWVGFVLLVNGFLFNRRGRRDRREGYLFGVAWLLVKRREKVYLLILFV